MRIFLDTCVLPEVRHPKGDLGVRLLLPESNKRRVLEKWLETLERLYADRLLPVDPETSRIWGELTAAARKGGRTVAVGDGLIAATARRHGLHVMTRNTADFESTGVLLLNPFSQV